MSIHTKRLEKTVSTASLLGARYLGGLWRTSWQVRLLCPRARHLTGRPRLYVGDRWPRPIGKINSQANADVPSKI